MDIRMVVTAETPYGVVTVERPSLERREIGLVAGLPALSVEGPLRPVSVERPVPTEWLFPYMISVPGFIVLYISTCK